MLKPSVSDAISSAIVPRKWRLISLIPSTGESFGAGSATGGTDGSVIVLMAAASDDTEVERKAKRSRGNCGDGGSCVDFRGSFLTLKRQLHPQYVYHHDNLSIDKVHAPLSEILAVSLKPFGIARFSAFLPAWTLTRNSQKFHLTMAVRMS
ncbi:MAG: hypothetical protein QM811_17830 [Pirellulales bacterium]